ncbi:DUF4260 domain-containing protein [Candidatus Gracilibacteria bacterium]|nr:DUF4260 domain-containing protein [Candidatus Gracilibacteria bacterium]
MPGVLLRLEGLALFSTAVALYAGQGFGWGLFALLLLAPDLAALGYLRSTLLGSRMYNVAHTTSLPLLLGLASLALAAPFGVQLALIWLAHIGMDRTVGYGLKYADSFKHTHLSEV